MRNAFSLDPGSGQEVPIAPDGNWLYGRVEAAHDDVVRFDAVDAEWQDRVGAAPWRLGVQESRASDDWPVSYLELPRRDVAGARAGQWWQLRIAEGTGAVWYPTLASDGRPVAVAERARLAPRPTRRLRAAIYPPFQRHRRLAGAAWLSLWEADGHAQQVPQAVGVHDVGQGAAVSVIIDDEPAVWIDAGGSRASGANAGSAGPLCDAAAWLVILTHWDRDHWSRANDTPSLLDLPWVAPVQAGGPAVKAFRQRLANLHLVSGADVPQHAPWLQVTQPDPAGGRNDGGLVARIIGPDGQVIHVGGDATYVGAEAVHAVVAAHHGGRTKTKVQDYPAPSASTVPTRDAARRVVYSYANGNRYGHPLSASVGAYQASGWTAAQRRDTPDGNVHLYWDAGDSAVNASCGSACCATSQR